MQVKVNKYDIRNNVIRRKIVNCMHVISRIFVQDLTVPDISTYQNIDLKI